MCCYVLLCAVMCWWWRSKADTCPCISITSRKFGARVCSVVTCFYHVYTYFISADPCPCHCRGEAPETAKHQQRPVLLHWQAVQLPFEGTICPAMPCRFGVAKQTFLSLLGGLWTVSYRRFKASKWATSWSFEKPSVLHCHAVKAWRRVLFPELGAALGILIDLSIYLSIYYLI